MDDDHLTWALLFCLFVLIVEMAFFYTQVIYL